jgi:alpha-glucosidase (family GH31 glycosyl hydrolase)
VYDLSNPAVRDWWVDHSVEMTSNEEIDGIFVDANVKAISPDYLLSKIGEEKNWL